MSNMVISLPNIVEIFLFNRPSIRHLQPFYQLPCLKSLMLFMLPKVEYGCDGSSSSSSSSSPSFPSLNIYICPMLTSIPLAPLFESLDLNSVSEKLLCQLLITTTTTIPSSSSSSSSSLSRLSSLRICNIEDLESLQEDVLRIHTSLKKLVIRWCPKLLRLSLSQEIQHLNALEDFEVHHCEELDLSDNGMNGQGLRSLRKLEIGDVPKLVSLPDGLLHVTTLQHLDVSGCPGLTNLPEWMSKIALLKVLSINIYPLLSERCQKETGEDWPKIAHIPKIDLDFQWIQ